VRGWKKPGLYNHEKRNLLVNRNLLTQLPTSLAWNVESTLCTTYDSSRKIEKEKRGLRPELPEAEGLEG
jgi:hypothetical protein